MPMLFNLSLSSWRRGFGKPCVASKERSGILGVYDEKTDTVRVPDLSQVFDALPHYYKKQFVKSKLSQMRTDCGDILYFPIYGHNDVWLNTVYCTPYQFEADPHQ